MTISRVKAFSRRMPLFLRLSLITAFLAAGLGGVHPVVAADREASFVTPAQAPAPKPPERSVLSPVATDTSSAAPVAATSTPPAKLPSAPAPAQAPAASTPVQAPVAPASGAPSATAPAASPPAQLPSAPASGAPVDLGEPVSSEKLGSVDPDALGLLSPTEGGLGASMWGDTSRAFVERLMTAMSLPTASPALNSLARRLLLSTAALPPGESILHRSLVSLRLEKLLALGDAAEAWQLAMLAKPGHVDEITMRLVTEAALIGPDSKSLCDRMPEIIAGHKSLDWQKALILCQLRAGDTKAVQVGLDVMREQKVKDDIFVMLVNRATNGGGKYLPHQLTPLRPLTLGLIRQMDAPMPPGLYARPEAVLIPEMLLAKAEDDNIRLVLAEKSAAKNIISAAQLAAVYRAIVFPPATLAGVMNGNESGPRLRALLFQAASQEQAPAKRVDLIVRFMKAADMSLLCGAGGQALAELAVSIPATSDNNVYSAELARLMALVGKPDKALEWLKLAHGNAGKLPAVAAQLQANWPVFVLAGVVTDAEYGQELKSWLNAMLTESDKNSPDERVHHQQAITALVMFSAAGFAVPEEAWLRVVDTTAGEKRMVAPSPLLLDRLSNAGTTDRRGEAVLLSIMLAGGGVNDTPLFVIADAVRALRLTGLTADALALARETVAAGSVAGN